MSLFGVRFCLLLFGMNICQIRESKRTTKTYKKRNLNQFTHWSQNTYELHLI